MKAFVTLSIGNSGDKVHVTLVGTQWGFKEKERFARIDGSPYHMLPRLCGDFQAWLDEDWRVCGNIFTSPHHPHLVVLEKGFLS